VSYDDHDPVARATALELLGIARAERRIAEVRAAALAPAPVTAPRDVAATEAERLRADVAALPFVGSVALAQALERAKLAQIDIDYRVARKQLAAMFPSIKGDATRAKTVTHAPDGARTFHDAQTGATMTMVHPSHASMQAAPAHVYEFPTAPESKGRR